MGHKRYTCHEQYIHISRLAFNPLCKERTYRCLRVANYPSNITCCKDSISFFEPKDIIHGPAQGDSMATIGTHNALKGAKRPVRTW